MKATTITKITAPKIDGTIAMSATFGPHSPKRAWPSEDPTNPAKILAIQFIDLPCPVKAPAIKPITPPTINTQIQCSILITFAFLQNILSHF